MGKILKYLLPLLFVSYVANITMFVHTHVVNGTTLVHSHPFHSSDHSHSEYEERFLELITHFSATAESVTAGDDVPDPVCRIIQEESIFQNILLSGVDVGACGSRGPPAV